MITIYCYGCGKDRPEAEFRQTRPERTSIMGRPVVILTHVGTPQRKGCHHRMISARGGYTVRQEKAL